MKRRDFLKTAAALPLLAQPSNGVNCIFLMLVGGPSQLDTWDPKPDAPSHIRSPYKPIKTNVPGIQISEIFPRMARHADKYALIRSCYHTGEPVHEISQQLMQPGHIGGIIAHAASFSSFAQNCLHARQLIESGTRFVTVKMFDSVFSQTTWDMHGSAPFSPMSCYRDEVGPMFDQAYSALLEDLHDRGLLATTLVVATGEFGRTPRINPAGGRDHWTECWTMLMAGGGIQGGQIIGASDAIGAEPRDRPVSPQEIEATIYHAMGIHHGSHPVLELFG